MNPAVDARVYRETLGHYPTGVVVVTGLDDSGRTAGMVIGSFTSVSLDPPLVAFLPMKGSGSFARLRSGTSFCVNVLAADQEDTCRHFASRIQDKFEGVAWTPAPSGAPILEGVVAWIDCEYDQVIEAGDHYIVVGRVTAMDVPRPALPLLFFQGGYGRFSPPSLVAPSDPAIIDAVRLSEAVRGDVERLAEELRADCSVLAAVGDEAVFVATANRSDRRGLISVGSRIPLIPPLGAVFVDSADEAAVETWLSRVPRLDDDVRSRVREKLAVVQDRGYSVSLRDGQPHDREFEEALIAYASGERLPDQERRLKDALVTTVATYEPRIDPVATYDVHSIVVPVPCTPDTPRMALRLSHLPDGVSGHALQECARRLAAVAARVAHPDPVS